MENNKLNVCKVLTYGHKVLNPGGLCMNNAFIWGLPTENGILLNKMICDQGSCGQADKWVSSSVVLNAPPEKNYLQTGISRKQVSSHFSMSDLNMTYKIMIDRTISPDINATNSLGGFKIVRWLPEFMDPQPTMVALTHDHKLLIYKISFKNAELHMIVDLSKEYNSHLKSANFAIVEERTKNSSILNKMHERSYALATVDVIVSNMWDNYCLLFTLMKSGHLVVWKVNYPISANCFELVEMIDTGNRVPSAGEFIRLTDSTGILLIGYVSGELSSLTVNISDGNLQVEENKSIWPDADCIMISRVKWMKNTSILLCAKGAYLFAFKLTFAQNTEIIVDDQSFVQISEKLPITSVDTCHQDIYVSSLDSKIFQCIIQLPGKGSDKLMISKYELNLTRPLSHTWGCYGISVTRNGIFLLDVASPISTYDHFILKEPLHLNFIRLKSCAEIIQEFTRLIADDTPMCQMVDMLVIIRAEILKSGSLPNGLENWTIEKSKWIEQRASWLKVMRFILKVKKLHQLHTNKNADDINDFDSNISMIDSFIMILHCSEKLLSLQNMNTVSTLHANDKITASLMCKVLLNSECSSSLKRKLAQDVSILLYKQGSIPDVLESCKICGVDISTKLVINEGCPNGHKIERCCQTLRICQDLPYRICENCHTFSVGVHVKGSDWFEKLKQPLCTFCDGLLS